MRSLKVFAITKRLNYSKSFFLEEFGDLILMQVFWLEDILLTEAKGDSCTEKIYLEHRIRQHQKLLHHYYQQYQIQQLMIQMHSGQIYSFNGLTHFYFFLQQYFMQLRKSEKKWQLFDRFLQHQLMSYRYLHSFHLANFRVYTKSYREWRQGDYMYHLYQHTFSLYFYFR